MTTPTVAAGYISDEARAFLLAHNVTIVSCLDLEVFTLNRMIGGITQGERPGEYVISFWAGEAEIEDDCLILHLDADASESKIILRKNYWPTFEAIERPVN